MNGAAPGWERRDVEADGVRLAAFVAGSRAADAPTAVLLHGLGYWTEATWDRVVPLLDPRWRLVAFDLPGFGASAPIVAGSYEIGRFGAALDAVRRTLAPGPVALVGHSLGALVAAEYAGDHADDVTHLALLAPAGFANVPRFVVRALAGRFAGWIFSRKPSRRFVVRMLNDAVVDRSAIDPLVVERAVALSEQRAVRQAFAGVYAGAMQLLLDPRAVRARFARYRGPVLIGWGERDKYTPISALPNVVATYPQARVARVAHSGHLFLVERPAEVAAALRGLLDAPLTNRPS